MSIGPSHWRVICAWLLVFLLMTPHASASGQQTDFDSLWDYDDPLASEGRFRELVASANAEPDDPWLLRLRTQIARAQGLQRDFDGAHATLDEVEPRIDAADALTRARHLLERGRVFNSSGKALEARPLFYRAYYTAMLGGHDFHTVDAAHMIAIVETDPERQMEWNLKAMEAAESSGDAKARGWLGSLYNNIGWTLHDAGRHEEALEIFQKALEVRKGQGKAGPIRIARWSVARALRSLQRLDEALEIQRSLLLELDTSGERDGYVFEELGELHLAAGAAEEAAPFFARAHAELSTDAYLRENEGARLERLRRLGAGGS